MTIDVPSLVFWSIAALVGFILQLREWVIYLKRDKRFRQTNPTAPYRERIWHVVPRMSHYFLASMLFFGSVEMIKKACIQTTDPMPELQRYIAEKQHEYNMTILLIVLLFGGLSLIGLILNAGNTQKENAL